MLKIPYYHPYLYNLYAYYESKLAENHLQFARYYQTTLEKGFSTQVRIGTKLGTSLGLDTVGKINSFWFKDLLNSLNYPTQDLGVDNNELYLDRLELKDRPLKYQVEFGRMWVNLFLSQKEEVNNGFMWYKEEDMISSITSFRRKLCFFKPIVKSATTNTLGLELAKKNMWYSSFYYKINNPVKFIGSESQLPKKIVTNNLGLDLAHKFGYGCGWVYK